MSALYYDQMGMRSGHNDEPEILWGPDHNDADREWRDAASDPEQYGTPKSSQDIESQRVHAHHFVNGEVPEHSPADSGNFDVPCILGRR